VTDVEFTIRGKERKPLVEASNSSVDVNALWAQMAQSQKKMDSGSTSASAGADASSNGLQAHNSQVPAGRLAPQVDETTTTTERPKNTMSSSTIPNVRSNTEDTIVIKRTYEFAGETLTEERVVPATSAEARLYLQQQQAAAVTTTPTVLSPVSSSATKPGLRRPKKRASIFGSDTATPPSGSNAAKGPKLTTLEKSKLDWAQYVDTEGITEELDEHSKAKGTYLGRLDFLGRMDVKREEEMKKGKGG